MYAYFIQQTTRAYTKYSFLAVHLASCTHFFPCDAKFLFHRVPDCNIIADLPYKIMFYTHKFITGPIGLGYSKSQDL